MRQTPKTKPAARRKWATIAAIAAILGLTGVFLWPTLLWAYHTQRAGALADQALTWPSPRRSDSLPSVADAAAIETALGHLAAAKRWRPDHSQAYRLAGQIYLARADWPRAAAELEQAHTRSPREPLIAWEAALAYEQMLLAISGDATTPLIDQIAAGQLSAPGQLVRSQFCNATGAASCYTGRVRYELPDSREPAAATRGYDAIFLHPPANLSATLIVPAATPVLRFAIGLDPVSRDWQSDGGSFRVLVRDAAAETEAATLTLDAAAARSGWTSAHADLTRWAGETITLTIASGAGPTGDLTDDWFAWGDLTLVTPDTAAYAPLDPEARMIAAWRAAGQVPSLFVRQRDQALAAGNTAAAETWQRRASLLDRYM
ncbi:MAG: hypothetical protein H7Z42_04880 [Roseiflexaceae bacterium]|nr:hypothetical protein [Roseiflexaceae bacterium]